MASASLASRASLAGAFPARLSARSRRASRGGASGASRVRLAPRAAVDPERDTILVTGCKERVAQCAVDQLSKNERSAGTTVKVCLPPSCYVGVRNPLNAMAKDLLYPDRPMIDCLGALDAVECVDQSDEKYAQVLADATGIIIANEYAPDVLEETKAALEEAQNGRRAAEAAAADALTAQRRAEIRSERALTLAALAIWACVVACAVRARR